MEDLDLHLLKKVTTTTKKKHKKHKKNQKNQQPTYYSISTKKKISFKEQLCYFRIQTVAPKLLWSIFSSRKENR